MEAAEEDAMEEEEVVEAVVELGASVVAEIKFIS